MEVRTADPAVVGSCPASPCPRSACEVKSIPRFAHSSSTMAPKACSVVAKWDVVVGVVDCGGVEGSGVIGGFPSDVCVVFGRAVVAKAVVVVVALMRLLLLVGAMGLAKTIPISARTASKSRMPCRNSCCISWRLPPSP